MSILLGEITYTRETFAHDAYLHLGRELESFPLPPTRTGLLEIIRIHHEPLLSNTEGRFLQIQILLYNQAGGDHNLN